MTGQTFARLIKKRRLETLTKDFWNTTRDNFISEPTAKCCHPACGVTVGACLLSKVVSAILPHARVVVAPIPLIH